MGFPGKAWAAVKYIFHIDTGYGKRPDELTAEGEAVAAVFLPLAGLAVGFAAACAAAAAHGAGLSGVSIVLGLAALAALGGVRRFDSAARLFSNDRLSAGAGLAAALVLLFEYLALAELNAVRGVNALCGALLSMPAAGALAILAAASAMREPEADMPLSRVKGLHLIVGAVLALLLMLPQHGLMSLAYAAVSVLAGAASAAVAGRKEYKPGALSLAALAAEILFLALALIVQKPVIYY